MSRPIARLALVLAFWILLIRLIAATGPATNPVPQIERQLAPYLPGHPIPGCGLVYMTEYMSCVVYGVPGTQALSLTASEYSGQIDVTFVILSEPVTIGDLKELYGDYELDRKKSRWEWRWESLVVYKYQPYGNPTLLTQVTMLSWRSP